MKADGRHVEQPDERPGKHMLARMLLHVIAAARRINPATNDCSSGERLLCEMEDAAAVLVGNFGDWKFPFVCQHQPADIVHLAAAGGIERRAVENNRAFACTLERFEHGCVESVEERVVVVEA